MVSTVWAWHPSDLDIQQDPEVAVGRLGNVLQQVLQPRHGLMGLLGRPEAADVLPIILNQLVRPPKAALQILVLRGPSAPLANVGSWTDVGEHDDAVLG
jgi:hypothetical protein